MWRVGWKMIQERPLTGVGPGRVDALYRSYLESGEPVPAYHGHLHNNAIQLAAEFGIPVALAAILTLGVLFLDLVKASRAAMSRDAKFTGWAGLLGLIGFVMSGLFDYTYGHSLGLILLGFVVLSPLRFKLRHPCRARSFGRRSKGANQVSENSMNPIISPSKPAMPRNTSNSFFTRCQPRHDTRLLSKGYRSLCRATFVGGRFTKWTRTVMSPRSRQARFERCFVVDVLLTHSYHLYYDRKQARKVQPYPPLGTLYSAALLRQHGYSVAVFDPMLEDPVTRFPEALRQAQPRVVALCEDNFNFLSKMCLSRMREVAMEMIGLSRAAGAQIVVNGSDSTDHLVQYLQGGANFIMIGEVERTLHALVDSLIGDSRQDPIEIPGLAFIKQDSRRLYKTPPRPLIKDLDELPFPARDLVDLDRYRDAWKSAHRFFSLNLVASRGCPYRCNWCAKPIYGDHFHSRSAENVAREMALLKTEYGAEHLWFADDILGIQNSWVLELAGHGERLDAAVPFKMQTRADLMKEDVALALDAMDKGLRIDHVEKARGHLRHAGIRTCFFLQFGYAGETWQDIRKTIELVRATRPEDIGVSVSYPLPGTVFHAQVREQLGSKTNWIDSEDLSMMFKGAYTTEFYRALRDAIHAEVETWSAPPAASESPSEWGNHFGIAGAQSVAQLWARVEEMEKTCRNEVPTLLPVLTCSSEAAAC